MNLEEVRANIGHKAWWRAARGNFVTVVIRRVIDQRWFGYDGPDRVWVQFDGFSSERDVAPEELTLQ